MYTTTIDYPGGPTISLMSCLDNNTPMPWMIAGHDATIQIRGDDPEEPMEAVIEPQRTGRSRERVVLKGERGDQAKHRANLVQAMRDSSTQLYCPVSLGLRTNIAITLGVRSFPGPEGVRLGCEGAKGGGVVDRVGGRQVRLPASCESEENGDISFLRLLLLIWFHSPLDDSRSWDELYGVTRRPDGVRVVAHAIFLLECL